MGRESWIVKDMVLLSELTLFLSFQDGIILGADRRATDDMVVADKNCAKIHHITDNI